MRQIAAAALTVMQAAEAYIAVMEKEWKTKRYASQIRARLETYVKPIIGHLPIADIGLAEIKQVLVPIWTNKRPTANRIRKHLEGAINWAIAEGHPHGRKQPGRGQAAAILAVVRRTQGHSTIPHCRTSEAPSFLAELRKQEGVKARALEFVMLTAVRVADICGGGKEHAVPMKWSHVDHARPDLDHSGHQDGPAARRAAERSGHAAARRDAALRDPATDFVFPGAKRGTRDHRCHAARICFRTWAMPAIATTHGMRATFRTWASETTGYDKDVIEAAWPTRKANWIRPTTVGHYLDKRRRLMAAWADYCGDGTMMHGAEVIEFRR